MSSISKYKNAKTTLCHGVVGSAFLPFRELHKIVMSLAVDGSFDLMKHGDIFLNVLIVFCFPSAPTLI